MNLIKISEEIYQVNFETIRDMNSMDLRLDLSLELGRLATRKESKRWFRKENPNSKNFDWYYGCLLFKENLEIIFKNIKSLTSKEKGFYEFFRELDFDYLIFTSDESGEGVLEHELSHIFYDENIHYRINQNYLLSQIPINLFDEMKKYLLEKNYSPFELKDEICSTLVEGRELFYNDEISLKGIEKIVNEIRNNFSEEYSEWVFEDLN